MFLRFKIDDFEEQIKQSLKKTRLLDDNIAKLEKEEDVADERLVFSNLNPEEIKSQIQKYQDLYIASNRKLIELSQKKEEKELATLQIFSERVQSLLIRSEINLEKIKLLFAQIYQGNKNKSEDELDEILFEEDRIVNVVSDLKQVIHSYSQNAANLNEEQIKQLKKLTEIFHLLKGKTEDNQILLSELNKYMIEEDTSAFHYLNIIGLKIKDFVQWVKKSLSKRLFLVNDYPVTIWTLTRAILIFVGFILFAQFALRGLKSSKRLKRKLGMANVYIISRIIYYTIIVLGLVITCMSIGFSVTNFVIIAGALGVGVGLGLQSIVNNFFSGLVILFAKTLKHGDIVETDSGFTGKVTAINMQNIHIQTFDGKDVIIPNADLVTKSVINWTTADPYVRLHIPFSVEYGTNKEKIEKIILDLAEKIPYTIFNEKIRPKPNVWLVGFGENSLNMELVVWVNFNQNSSRGSMVAEYLWEIEKEFDKHGIAIPFPQSDLHLKDLPPITIHQKN